MVFPNTTAYRWIKYEAPPGSYGRVVELEFYDKEQKLTGQFSCSFPHEGWRHAIDGYIESIYNG